MSWNYSWMSHALRTDILGGCLIMWFLDNYCAKQPSFKRGRQFLNIYLCRIAEKRWQFRWRHLHGVSCKTRGIFALWRKMSRIGCNTGLSTETTVYRIQQLSGQNDFWNKSSLSHVTLYVFHKKHCKPVYLLPLTCLNSCINTHHTHKQERHPLCLTKESLVINAKEE